MANNVNRVQITSEMKSAYIDYAMSVIVARALPDIRDGLKPVQRRIIYDMYLQGLRYNTKYRKCAGVVGDVMKYFHPHGDSSIYEALVRMAQDWNMRYMLVDGQGNFGSMDGDGPAAYRYTECRLQRISEEMIADIDNKTVDYGPNYDATEEEPLVLSTRVPTLLLNGANGIAVGMATTIPPHNLTEVMDALIHLIDKHGATYSLEKQAEDNLKSFVDGVASFAQIKQEDDSVLVSNSKHIIELQQKFNVDADVKELMQFVKGPDFPTSGIIYEKAAIETVYSTGRGRILMRGVAKIEESSSGRFQIIVTELPYQVNKARFWSRIAELVKIGKLEGITDIRDESNSIRKEPVRVVIDLKRDANPQLILNHLYKFTELQSAYNANVLALVDGEPRTLGLKDMLELFIQHRQEIVIRRSLNDLNKNKLRAHILEGLKRALDILDEVIATIRGSKNSADAKVNLMTKYQFTEIQAQAILDMTLSRLAALERQRIIDEYNEVIAHIEMLRNLLSKSTETMKVIKDEFVGIREKYGDKRRTKVIAGKPGEFSDEDLIAEEDVVLTLSKSGYIKRMSGDTYKAQGRGGKGVVGATFKEGDVVSNLLYANSHDEILFFTNKGKVYQLKVYEIPEASRTAKGTPLVNCISIDQGESVTSLLTRNKNGGFLDEDITQEGEQQTEKMGADYKFLFMSTKKGTVKKVKLEEFTDVRRNGLIAIALDNEDELTWTRPSTGKSDILIVSKDGKAIRFNEKDVRELGRSARGVRGITLSTADEVVGMDVVRSLEDKLLVVSENGYGKVTALSEYPQIGRGGKGVKTANINAKTGKLTISRTIDATKKEALLMSKQGQTIRVSLGDIRESSRATSGVRIINLKDNDKLAAVTIL